MLGTFVSGSSWAASGTAAPAHAAVRAADPPPLVDESFTHATAPAFTGYASACLTGAAPVDTVPPGGGHPLGGCPYHTAVGPVPPGNADPHGYLWLTDAGHDRSAAVLYNHPIPANEGLRLSFDQWQYGSTTPATPADGISAFLVDGAATLSAPGAFGGSLGYAQKLPDDDPANPFLPGVNHGYLGVGLDVLGNYFGDWEHRGHGCTPPETSPAGTAFHIPAPGRNMITVRGPGDGTEGYCWLGATYTGTASPFTSTLHGSLQGPTTSVSSDPATAEAQLEESRRRVNIEITPAPNPLMTVTVDYSDGTGPHVEIRNMPLPQPVPATYKFGFAASTGGFTDVHLIRNVVATPYDALPQLNLVKQLDKDYPLPNPIVAGSVLHYQFVVTNSGGVPLTDIAVNDPTVGPVTCPDRTLAPGQTETCTGTYTVTAADVADGYVHNVARATGSNEGEPVQSPESEFDVPIARSEVLTLDKTVDDTHPYQPGDIVTYHYVVTNTSDQAVSSIAVHDDRVTNVECERETLTPAGTPDAATTCTGTYTVTAADQAAGHVTNTAHAAGTGADGTNLTSPPDSARIEVAAPGPSLRLEKSVDDSHAYKPGDVVTYTYRVRNVSDSEVTDLRIDDDRVSGITCDTTTLAPHSSTTCTGYYTVTDADAQAGRVVNTARASGTVAGETVHSPKESAEICVVAVTPTPTPTPTPSPTTPPCSPTTPPTPPTPTHTHATPHTPIPTSTHPSGHLPSTGTYVTLLTFAGVAALATGGFLFVSMRRRRIGHRHH